MNGDNASAVRIPPLDGKNYNIWAIKFQNLMIVKGKGDVLDPLEGTTVTASDDRLVKAHMILTADDAHAVDIQAAVSAKAAWDSLAGKYKALTIARQMQVQRELQTLRLGAGEDIPAYVGRARALHAETKVIGVEVPENSVVLSMLEGLSADEYDWTKQFLSMSETPLTLDGVLPRLLIAEQRKVTKENEASSFTLMYAGHTNKPRAGAQQRQPYHQPHQNYRPEQQ